MRTLPADEPLEGLRTVLSESLNKLRSFGDDLIWTILSGRYDFGEQLSHDTVRKIGNVKYAPSQ